MSNKPIEDPAKVRLKNVRLSFPKLFKAEAVQKGQEPKFSASFLLNKKADAAQIELIKSTIEAVKKSKWGNSIPKGIKLCLHDGSEKEEHDGYDDTLMFVSSSSTRRPVVVDKDIRPLTAEDSKPYAGCYVNCTIRLWAQDNDFGKRINAELCAVQFARDGEEFSGKPKINAEEEFTSLEDDEDDLG
jgi:hypothetical protein